MAPTFLVYPTSLYKSCDYAETPGRCDIWRKATEFVYLLLDFPRQTKVHRLMSLPESKEPPAQSSQHFQVTKSIT